MKKDPRIYFAQILERIVRIEAFTKSGKESFLVDPLVQDAVLRKFKGQAMRRPARPMITVVKSEVDSKAKRKVLK